MSDLLSGDKFDGLRFSIVTVWGKNTMWTMWKLKMMTASSQLTSFQKTNTTLSMLRLWCPND